MRSACSTGRGPAVRPLGDLPDNADFAEALVRRRVYSAVLAERLRVAVGWGATLALVKGRLDTSAPILRRFGFYDVPV